MREVNLVSLDPIGDIIDTSDLFYEEYYKGEQGQKIGPTNKSYYNYEEIKFLIIYRVLLPELGRFFGLDDDILYAITNKVNSILLSLWHNKKLDCVRECNEREVRPEVSPHYVNAVFKPITDIFVSGVKYNG